MPNYQNGKIYCLRSPQTDDVYIGSTIQSLAVRKGGHLRVYKLFLNKKYNYVSSFELTKYDDFYIELIENYPCNCRDELNKREGEIIRDTENCVNVRIAGRTPKEYYENNKEKITQRVQKYLENNKEKIKEYRENNKEKIAKRNKEYRENNKEKLSQYNKEYHENNKEKITQRVKKYLENNKEKIAKRKKEYYENNKEAILQKRRERRENEKKK